MTCLVVGDPAHFTGCHKRWGIPANYKTLELWQCPTGASRGEGRDAHIANLVVLETKHLRMAHQTKRPGQKRAHAKSQGQRTW